jgi:hypothetical protein
MNRSLTPTPLSVYRRVRFAVQDGFLQGTFHDVIVDRRACLLEKASQLWPVIQ